MKAKDFSKKLILNKKTIANLNKKEMENVEGGEQPITAGTWCDGSCCIVVGGDSGCLTVYPKYCMPHLPN